MSAANTMHTATLLVELVTEELPPKALKRLGESFANSIRDGLVNRHFLEDGHPCKPYMTPRRLAVLIENVPAQGTAIDKTLKLMPAKVAFDATNQPTPALRKRLEKEGYPADVDVAALECQGRLSRREEGTDVYVFHTQTIGAQPLERALEEALADALDALPIPKVMSYAGAGGYYNDVKFVRPAHRLVALHGENVVPVSALGLRAGQESFGHRFLAEPDQDSHLVTVRISSADDYPRALHEEGRIIASFEERREAIREELLRVAGRDTVIMPDALLDEVTALVEWPVVYAGHFEEAFLKVPQECLILTMQQNQKYFALTDASGRMLNRFLLVSNIETADPSAIIEGNERVIRPRLADARFFFDQDRKKKLESRLPGLDKVVYHNKLGSQGERVERVRAIARAIATQLGIDATQVDAAAKLAKADLLTDMVGEFPELQGIMGSYYARHDGLGDTVAEAIEDHYKPRFAGDALPRKDVGVVVALADKLETLTGMFGIGQLPTGDKDPFALRRHALGVIRMLIERDLAIGLDELIGIAIRVLEDESIQAAWAKRMFDGMQAEGRFRSGGGDTVAAAGYQRRKLDPRTAELLSDFFFDRLAGSLREQGYSAQEVEAVIALRPQRLGDVAKRLAAVRAFAALPEAAALAAANKRVGNILKKSEDEAPASVDATLLAESAEVELYRALHAVGPSADTAFGAGDYSASLRALAALKGPVDAFFDNVMVNVDNSALRMNRLSLLKSLHGAMNRVADLSKLAA